MTTETISPEVIAPDDKLLAIVEQNSLAPDAAKGLQVSFAPLFKQAGELLAQSKTIVVTDASQTMQIEMSRIARLALRKVRTTGESLRKSLQEDAGRRIKAINGFQHILEELVGAEETRLAEGEKIVERKEAARKAQLKTDREAALKPFGIDTTFFALGDMTDEAWSQLLDNSQAAHARKIEEARKAQEERIRAENERLKEEQRIREENAKLKSQAEERERAAKVERERVERERAIAEAQLAEERRVAKEANEKVLREKAEAEADAKRQREFIEAKAAQEKRDAEARVIQLQRASEDAAAAAKAAADKKTRAALEKARKEREDLERQAADAKAAQQRAENEAQAVRLAEERRKAQEAEDARKAALAPEREKLSVYANSLRAVVIPALDSEGGILVVDELRARVEKLAKWVEVEAQRL